MLRIRSIVAQAPTQPAGIAPPPIELANRDQPGIACELLIPPLDNW
jgi:hypothetical protein